MAEAWSDYPAWPALVDQELCDRVNRCIRNTHGTRRRLPRSEPGKYLFSGPVRCGHCGKSMHGTTARAKPYYRREATRPDYAAPSVPGHPPTYTVREERLAAAADEWLGLLAGPDQIDATVAAVLGAEADSGGEPEHVTAARHRQQ